MPNRLAHESSPYLLQHANNPVDWFPWGAELIERARREQKPIFLSIGYSACHWCHVMEHESFENEAIAGLMMNQKGRDSRSWWTAEVSPRARSTSCRGGVFRADREHCSLPGKTNGLVAAARSSRRGDLPLKAPSTARLPCLTRHRARKQNES